MIYTGPYSRQNTFFNIKVVVLLQKCNYILNLLPYEIWTDLHFCVEKQFSPPHFYPDNKFLLPSSSHWKDLILSSTCPSLLLFYPQHPRQLACHCHANVRNLQLMLNIIRSEHILNFCLIYSCNFHFKKTGCGPTFQKTDDWGRKLSLENKKQCITSERKHRYWFQN